MQRGVLRLTKEEAQALSPFISAMHEDYASLAERWKVEKSGEVAIEISAEQAEALLDTLPTPTTGEEHLSQVRLVVSQFLSTLRAES